MAACHDAIRKAITAHMLAKGADTRCVRVPRQFVRGHGLRSYLVQVFGNHADGEGVGGGVPFAASHSGYVLIAGAGKLEHDELDGGLRVDDPVVRNARLGVRIGFAPRSTLRLLREITSTTNSGG